MTTLQAIALEDAAPGMILADALQDETGQMLLPKGSELTESVLRSLGRRGIETLSILIPEAVDESALIARREAARQRLQHLFRQAVDPTSQGLLRVMLEYREEHPQ